MNLLSSVVREAHQLRTSQAVTRTQCCIMRSHPPPAPSSGTRRLTVRSQSLAALHAIVSSYLLPMEWRLRSCLTAPHEAQAARPPGTATMSSRHASGQPHSTPHAAVMPAAPAARCKATTHRSGPWCCCLRALPASPHRPAVIITTSRTALLKLRPVGPGFAQAAEPPPPPPAPPASASIASHRSFRCASLTICLRPRLTGSSPFGQPAAGYLRSARFGLFVLGLHALACVSV